MDGEKLQMSDLYQDITVTLNLSEMTPKKYHAILRKLNSLSISVPDTYTYTYDSKFNTNNKLSEEHILLLNKLRK